MGFSLASSPAQPLFLPMSRTEMDILGWDELDILLISGDAYVDHPSFGVALLGRHLVSRGFRVGIIAQPPWQFTANRDGAEKDTPGQGKTGPDNPARGETASGALLAMGRPRLFAGITAGAIDSMLARYTAFRKQRSDDAYTPGGLAGSRPNRAVTVYANLARRVFPGLPLVLGGIEASLRRASHYDFWTDSLRRSVLLDSKADLLVYGMGETALTLAAEAARDVLAEAGGAYRAAFMDRARRIPGTVWATSRTEADRLFPPEDKTAARLPSHEAILEDPFLLVRGTMAMERHVHQGGLPLLQDSGDRTVVMTPPAPPLETAGLDALYGLPYARLPHPAYDKPVPAWEMIRTSITSHRGCGGGCAFCSLALHQTRRIASRSGKSILTEAAHISSTTIKGKIPAWAGSISDVGGPSANMWRAVCAKGPEKCERQSCLFPSLCPFFRVNQAEGAALLRKIAALKGVRHVRVASGVRFDLAMRDDAALAAYTSEFTGGQLKVAPEHIAEPVLRLMRKPALPVFEAFLDRFYSLSRNAGKEQYVIPYLMSAYPGCTDEHMRELSRWLKKRNWSPRQVQCFIPTPGTVATAMFYAGKDPDGNPIPVAKTDAERMRQHYILLGREGESAGGRDYEPRPKNRSGDSKPKMGDTRGKQSGGKKPGHETRSGGRGGQRRRTS